MLKFENKNIGAIKIGSQDVYKIYKGKDLIYEKAKFPKGQSVDFDYTETVQSITLPRGKYKLQVWGAQGGNANGSANYSGKGGYSEGVLSVLSPQTLYVNVGGKGAGSGTGTTAGKAKGGWNGGGNGQKYGQLDSSHYTRSGGGGGATDIATIYSNISYVNNTRTERSQDSLLSRIIVAGGGAGGCDGKRIISNTTTTASIYETKPTNSKESWISSSISIDKYLVYESNASYNVNSAVDWVKITFTGTEFTLYINSYAETSYDYTIAFNADFTPSDNVLISPSTSSTGVKLHTSSYQKDPSEGLSAFKTITYTGLSSGSHYIFVCYRKDDSVNSFNDKGYIAFSRGSATIKPMYVISSSNTTETPDLFQSSPSYIYGGGLSGGSYGGQQTQGGDINGNVNFKGVFGYGCNCETASTYLATGGGGGGWYGGAAYFINSYWSGNTIANYCGGGSGYVFDVSTISNYPSGCKLTSKFFLENAQTIAGNASMPRQTIASVNVNSSGAYVKEGVVRTSGSASYTIDHYGNITWSSAAGEPSGKFVLPTFQYNNESYFTVTEVNTAMSNTGQNRTVTAQRYGATVKQTGNTGNGYARITRLYEDPTES